MFTKIVKDKKIVHKNYDQTQPLLLPVDLKTLIPEGHLVFIVDRIVESLSMEDLNKYYKGGGGSTYHPKMLIKLWIYGYCDRVYTSRRLAKAMRENIHFMYLSGQQYPCFKSLSEFRGERMQGMITLIFKEVLLLLFNEGYIDLGDLYLDGSKWEANANRHKRIWRKNTERYKAVVTGRIESLLEEIKVLQQEEDESYGQADLREVGEGKDLKLVLSSADVNQHLAHLQEVVKSESSRAEVNEAKIKKLNSLGKKVYEEREKLIEYEYQEQTLGTRNSYSKTDEDATMLRMKDERLLPGYNIQISTSMQYVVSFSIHPNGSDSPTLIPHLAETEGFLEGLDQPHEVDLTADAAYGNEENYGELEKRNITAYVKYSLWHQEQTGELAKKIFRRENWPFDELSDTYECPNHRKLVFVGEAQGKTYNGYEKTVRVYRSENCQDCPFSVDCNKSEDKNKTIQYSPQGEAYRQKAKERLATPRGLEHRSNRSIEVESTFGDIKYNMKHDRFILRGKAKIKVEFGLLAIGHNLRKVYCEKSGIWVAYYAQRASKREQNKKKRA